MTFTAGAVLTAAQLNTFDPSTKITNAGGSNSAPSYTFNGDTDTGMYRSAADEIAFATGGTQRLTIQADGQVGIGTTTPFAPLQLFNSTTDTVARIGSGDNGVYISFYDSGSTNETNARIGAYNDALVFLTGGSDRVTIKDDGDVGIGITPQQKLDIAADGPTLRLTDTDTTLANDELSSAIEFFSSDSSGSGVAAYVHADGDGNTGSLQLQLGTGTPGGAADRLTIAADGDIGINEATPSARLHVNAGTINNVATFESTDAGAIISLVDSSTTGSSYVGIRADGDVLSLRAGNSNMVKVQAAGNLNIETASATLVANPPTGTGNDAEWVAIGSVYELKRNSSLTAEKDNISNDLGTHLTVDMIDSVVPKMWNRVNAPGIPEIGPLAEDMDAISPFLAAHGFDDAGDVFLTGINKTAYLSLLVLAVKDLRARVATLEA